jgi:hypothetical protein
LGNYLQLWQGSYLTDLSARIQAIETQLLEMTGHVEKVLEASIARGIEQLHTTIESVMAKFLANTNPRGNDIRSIGMKETLVTGTLGANPTSIARANPIAAMRVDIIEVDTTSNPKQHKGGHAIKDGSTHGWQDASKITKVLSMSCEFLGSESES